MRSPEVVRCGIVGQVEWRPMELPLEVDFAYCRGIYDLLVVTVTHESQRKSAPPV